MALAGAISSTEVALAAADLTDDDAFSADLDYQSGWGSYGSGYQGGEFQQDQFGHFRLRGLVARTSGSGTLIGVLPDEIPARALFASYINGAAGRIDLIPSSGSTEIHLFVGSPAYVQLDRIYTDVGVDIPTLPKWGTQPSDQTIDGDQIDRNDWTFLSMRSGYTYWGSPYYTPAYRKTPDGIVHLRGLAKMTTKTALPVVIADLPSGSRPSSPIILTHDANGAASYLLVNTDGSIQWNAGSPADNAHIGLDGLCFDAGTTTGATYGAQPSNSTLVQSLLAGIEGWTNGSLQNSWVSFGSPYYAPGYRKDQYGRVYLRGLAKSGTIGGDASIFTTATGYRPAARRLFGVHSNGVLGRVDVGSDGKVICVTGSNAWVSLDGIWFDT